MRRRSSQHETRCVLLYMVLAAALLLTACATPRLQPVDSVPDYAFPPARSGALHEISDWVTRETGHEDTAYLPLVSNPDALRWRLLLAGKATISIDAQYYLWDGDESGKLLILALLDAADRGVRVRLLIDDVFTLDTDEEIAVLDSHPNISVRIFNPWQRSGGMLSRGLEFIGNAERLNQRMHNKLFVADNQVAIVGGRNIGNPYFGFGSRYNFRDIEVITVGPVAEDISDSFDIYWNDEWSVPGAAFGRANQELPPPGAIRRELQQELEAPDRCYPAGLGDVGKAQAMLARLQHASSSGDVWVVYDDPPSRVASDEGVRKVEKLRDIDPDISEELLIASAYFIPDERFLKTLAALVEEGVRVVVLTNSLASTNHTMVNSGYAPWRRKLLAAGIELYEYRGEPAIREGIVASGLDGGRITLHTKTFVIDRDTVYIGSLNIDPRSMHINTEMGLLIEDPQLAGEVVKVIENDLHPDNAWRVSMDEEGRLSWESVEGVRYLQPARHLGQRIADFFYSLLPIKDQL